jgi:hypothetical protein
VRSSSGAGSGGSASSSVNVSGGSESGSFDHLTAGLAFHIVYRGAELCYESKGLEPGCRYAFRLSAVNAAGKSACSQVSISGSGTGTTYNIMKVTLLIS